MFGPAVFAAEELLSDEFQSDLQMAI